MRLLVIEGQPFHDFFRVADSLLANGGIVFDVGANQGLLSAGLAGKYGPKLSFHLFEPNGALIGMIRRTLAHYPETDFKINQVAVSDSEGEQLLIVFPNATGASYLANGIMPETVHESHRVHTTTLDQYASSKHVRRIDLLKVDIEGHELAALQGAAQLIETRAIQAIFFEYTELLRHNQNPKAILEFLDRAGYTSCVCAATEVAALGATHTIRQDLPGYGLPLTVPNLENLHQRHTDLLAVPRENLVMI
jgi:FkbM family methyltransferase